ncbi:hypothetical protein M3Y98_00886000 [Aphelenchoides besseyi]|nr:hypothetical protein M3Y98_00886000 [Aphelenchoides besseyi]KAI6192944.1 hypothetical protein M3Y96_00966100 [Aphelenchoides besseyi]
MNKNLCLLVLLSIVAVNVAVGHLFDWPQNHRMARSRRPSSPRPSSQRPWYTTPSSPQCAPEICSTYSDSCSSNPECTCFKDVNGNGVCAESGWCSGVDSCDNCDPSTSVCIVGSCCGYPICKSLSDTEACKNPGPSAGTVLKGRKNRLQRCRNDSHCGKGQSCRMHMNGMFCG